MSYKYLDFQTKEGMIDAVIQAYNVFSSILINANLKGIRAVEDHLFPEEFSKVEVKSSSISEDAKLYASREQAELENWPRNAKILEIGVCSGVHLLSIAKNLKPKLIHGVDINLKQLNRSITLELDKYASDERKIEIFEANSIEFLKNMVEQENSYDVIYIDALHRYPYVAKEIELSMKLLSKGGKLVLNDYCLWFVPSMEPCGVIKAVNELLDQNENLIVEYYAINDRDVCIGQQATLHSH